MLVKLVQFKAGYLSWIKLKNLDTSLLYLGSFHPCDRLQLLFCHKKHNLIFSKVTILNFSFSTLTSLGIPKLRESSWAHSSTATSWPNYLADTWPPAMEEKWSSWSESRQPRSWRWRHHSWPSPEPDFWSPPGFSRDSLRWGIFCRRKISYLTDGNIGKV